MSSLSSPPSLEYPPTARTLTRGRIVDAQPQPATKMTLSSPPDTEDYQRGQVERLRGGCIPCSVCIQFML